MQLKVSHEKGITTFTLNRKSHFNALTPEMIQELTTALNFDHLPDVLVIRGAGGNFHSGGDIHFFASTLDQDLSGIQEDFTPLLSRVNTLIKKLRCLPIPTVCVVEGVCAGFGLSLMLACDIAIACPKARFFPAYLSMGLSPDGGASYLPLELGYHRALAFFALHKELSAEKMMHYGLLHSLSNNLEKDCLSLCKQVQSLPKLAFCKTKELLLKACEQSFEQHLESEAKHFIACLGSEECKGRLTAFVNKKNKE